MNNDWATAIHSLELEYYRMCRKHPNPYHGCRGARQNAADSFRALRRQTYWAHLGKGPQLAGALHASIRASRLPEDFAEDLCARLTLLTV